MTVADSEWFSVAAIGVLAFFCINPRLTILTPILTISGSFHVRADEATKTRAFYDGARLVVVQTKSEIPAYILLDQLRLNTNCPY